MQDRPVGAGLGPVPQPGGQQVEVLEFRSYEGAGLGIALMRDGSEPRSIETLLRYRGGAIAELMRALRALKALQAEARAHAGAGAEAGLAARAPEPVPMQLATVATARDPAPLNRPAARNESE